MARTATLGQSHRENPPASQYNHGMAIFLPKPPLRRLPVFSTSPHPNPLPEGEGTGGVRRGSLQ